VLRRPGVAAPCADFRRRRWRAMTAIRTNPITTAAPASPTVVSSGASHLPPRSQDGHLAACRGEQPLDHGKVHDRRRLHPNCQSDIATPHSQDLDRRALADRGSDRPRALRQKPSSETFAGYFRWLAQPQSQSAQLSDGWRSACQLLRFPGVQAALAARIPSGRIARSRPHQPDRSVLL